MRYRLTREMIIPQDAEVIHEDQARGTIVYGYLSPTGKLGGMAFKGRAQKPAWHYIFRDTDQRQAQIDRWLKSIGQHTDYMAERKQRQQAEIAEANIKPGNYFYTSWGYDQTNIDYIVVVRVTAKTAVCRMVEPIHVGESNQQDVLMPGVAYGDSFRMKISGTDTLNGSYPYCPGHSSLRMGYFSKTSLGETRLETAAQFGH